MEITREDIVRMTNGMYAASILLLERNEKLEQLCRDMYENLEKWELPPNSYLTKRMADLGLLEDGDESTEK